MKLIPLFLLSISLCHVVISQNETIPPERWAMVEDHLRAQSDFSGIVMMGHAGQIRINHASGFADRASQKPYSDLTLGTIGSIVKPFTATGIMLLYEQGKLQPSDLLRQYFPGVPADKKEITLHHLLTHTSGLPGAIGDDYGATTDGSFLDMVWSTPLNFTPGTEYEYSNVGFSLLGMIIEKVSGMSYSAFLDRYVIQPAGMKTAGYRNPAADVRHLSHGYRQDGSDWGTSYDKPWNGDEPYWHLKANGGMLMSARDMYQWYLALRNHTVLKPATLALQTYPHVKERMEDSYYGYGYVVDRDGECIQHNGGNGIFKADFRWFPQSDIFLYATTNDANVRLFLLVDEVIRILETGEQPASFHWVPLAADQFPSNENENVAHALAQLLEHFTEQKAKTFLPDHFTEGIVERNGRERLLDLLQMLHTDTGGSPLEGVMTSGNSIMLVYPAGPQGARLKIILTLQGHRIDRIGAEMEG